MGSKDTKRRREPEEEAACVWCRQKSIKGRFGSDEKEQHQSSSYGSKDGQQEAVTPHPHDAEVYNLATIIGEGMAVARMNPNNEQWFIGGDFNCAVEKKRCQQRIK